MAEQQVVEQEQPETESTEDTEPQMMSIEDEFTGYATAADDLQKRLDKLSSRLLEKGDASAKASDLAAVVGILRGDVVELFKDQTNSCGALFVDAFNALSEEGEGDDDGEEGDEGESGELDQDAIQLYATLYANAKAFEGMVSQVPDEQKGISGFQSMIAMNQDGMKLIEEQVGPEVKAAAEKWLADAAAAAGATTGS